MVRHANDLFLCLCFSGFSGCRAGQEADFNHMLLNHFADGGKQSIELLCRIDTQDEVDYYENGGILPYVLRNLAA